MTVLRGCGVSAVIGIAMDWCKNFKRARGSAFIFLCECRDLVVRKS